MMKTFLISIGLSFIFTHALSQEADYPSLDEAGWYIINLEEPQGLKDTDVGAVNYLITLNEKGKIKSIRILTSTFTNRAERSWRKKILSAEFIKIKDIKTPGGKIRGTLLITRDTCNKDAAADFL